MKIWTKAKIQHDIIDKMEDVMPYKLNPHMKPYITEAMELYHKKVTKWYYVFRIENDRLYQISIVEYETREEAEGFIETMRGTIAHRKTKFRILSEDRI